MQLSQVCFFQIRWPEFQFLRGSERSAKCPRRASSKSSLFAKGRLILTAAFASRTDSSTLGPNSDIVASASLTFTALGPRTRAAIIPGCVLLGVAEPCCTGERRCSAERAGLRAPPEVRRIAQEVRIVPLGPLRPRRASSR